MKTLHTKPIAAPPRYPDIIVKLSSSRDIVAMHEVEVALRQQKVSELDIDMFLQDAFAAPNTDAVMRVCKRWVNLR